LILTIALWQMHATIMTLSLIFFILAIISTFLKNNKWWFKGHKVLGSVGFLFAIVGIFIAFYMVNKTSGEHFTIFHAKIGLLTIIILGLTVGLTPLRGNRNLRKIHIIMSLISLLLIIGTMMYGLMVAGVI